MLPSTIISHYSPKFTSIFLEKHLEIARAAILGNFPTAIQVARKYEKEAYKVSRFSGFTFSLYLTNISPRAKAYKEYLLGAIRSSYFIATEFYDVVLASQILIYAIEFIRQEYTKDENWIHVKRAFVYAHIYLSYYFIVRKHYEEALKYLELAYRETFFVDWTTVSRKIQETIALIEELQKQQVPFEVKNFRKLPRAIVRLCRLNFALYQKNISLENFRDLLNRTFISDWKTLYQFYLTKTEIFNELLAKLYNRDVLAKAAESDYNEILGITRLKKKKEKILESIRELETRLLPEEKFSYEFVEGSFKIIPAYHTSGDIVDYIYNFRNNKLYLLVADVVGHGLKAAGYALTLKSYFRRAVKRSVSFDKNLPLLLSGALEVIAKEGENAAFNLLEISDTEVKIIGGGLPLLVYYSYENNSVQKHYLKGLPLGLPEYFYGDFQKCFARISRNYKKNDIIIIFSDGLIEQTNLRGDVFSEDKLITFIMPFLRDASPEEINAKILEYWKKWKGSETHDDDVTLLTLKFK